MILTKEDDLQTMCLNVIVSNIERYILLKSKWDDSENIQKPTTIDFLRHWHSDYLHSSFRKKGKIITCEILNFLLSPHWKKVRIYSCHAAHPSLFTKLKDIGPGITFLSLKHILVSPSIINAIICCVPNVVYLNLCGTSCDDSNLHFISKTCKHLKMLNLFECNVTDAGLAALMRDSNQTSFNSLQALNLEGTAVTKGCIPYILSYFKSLLHFNYPDFPTVMHTSFLRGLISGETTFNLKSFDHKCPAARLPYPFQVVNIMSIISLWAKCCPQVTRMSVYDTINQDLLELLSHFKHLESLHLNNLDIDTYYNRVSYIHFTDSTFFKLRAAQLTSLSVNCAVISLKAILDSCISLKFLSLSSVSFKDVDIPAAYMNQYKLSKLESLKFTSVDVENEIFKPLEIMLHFAKNLITLGLRYCLKINREVVAWILNMPNLKELDLTFSEIKSELLLVILSSKSIKVIHTTKCPYSHEIYEPHAGYVNNTHDENTCGWKVSYNSNDHINQDLENKSIFSWSDSQVIIDNISV